MATRVFDYRDFSGGDYGRIDNWRAPKNSFSGNNMLVYRTGELGVRAGVRDVTPASGVAAGIVRAFGKMPSQVNQVFYNVSTETALRYFVAAQGATQFTATGSFSPSLASPRARIDDTGHTVYFATSASNGYSLTGTTLTALNNMPNAQAIALYGSRLAIVPTANQNRVRFSAAASFNNWTVSAGNAVEVTIGDSDPITGLFAQRTHLVVMKKNSGIYIVTGTPGTDMAVRQVSRYQGPVESWQAGRARGDESIWYSATLTQPPGEFDGARVSWYDNIPTSLYPELADRAAVPLRQDDQNAMAFVSEADGSGLGSSNEVWLRYRGIWTKHTFGVTITSQVASAGASWGQDGDTTPSRIRIGSMLVFTDGGGAAVAPKFYSWLPFTDRPGLEVSPFSLSSERTGDASSTPVTGSALLAEQRDDNGQDIQVRGVIVDFRTWNTGGASNNHFDLTVNTLNSYESAAPVSSATVSFDEAPSLSSRAGDVRSKYFSVGDQGRGMAFNVNLTNVRGVAFQRIRVVTETFPPRF